MSRVFFAVIIIGGLLSSVSFGYSGGSGTAGDPYQIGTAADLLELAATTSDYGAYFILTADIDLGSDVFTTAVIAPDTDNSTSGFQGVYFTGDFNGNGRTISNLTIDTAGAGNDYLGLFGRIFSGSEIKNLRLENVRITGGNNSQFSGGLVGENYNGSIRNCSSTGIITGGVNPDALGGLAGISYDASISNCYSNVDVSGGDNSYDLGGLVGFNEEGSIIDCYSTGDVTGGDNSKWLGGLAGFERNSNISNCYSMGNVTGGTNSDSIGGLVGYNDGGSISNCHSTGAVTGTYGLGGLVGYNASSISNCYSTGAVTGTYGLGGLVGFNESGSSISNCYSTGAVAGGDNSGALGGLVGYNNGGNISDCFSICVITGGDNSYSIGGLVGGNGGSISECYSIGAVTGGNNSWSLGGLVGGNGGSISDCYSTGNVSGTFNLGGLVGYNNGGNIGNCHSIGTVTGTSNFGGLVGWNDGGGTISSCYFLDTSGPNNGNGTPLTDAQMKHQANFVGWDFVNVWYIYEGVCYPKLCVFGRYSGGSGTPEDPYLIATAEDMNQIGRNYQDWDKCFRVIADINLSAYTGTQFSRIGTDAKHAFSGVFDGNGHTISNFTYTAENKDFIGVFGNVSSAGRIENVSLVDVNVSGRYYVGGLVGYSEGTIGNSSVAGTVSGYQSVGGLVGENVYGGSISDCYSRGDVAGGDNSYYLGGLVGLNYGTISNCDSAGNVTGGYNSYYLGGMVGYQDWGYISNSNSTGAVTGGDESYYLGGLVGENYGYISYCYSTSIVTGGYDSDCVGGLVGYVNEGYVTDCYAKGEVAGDYDVGGLVGINDGTIIRCYSSGSVLGYMFVGGLLGWNYGGTTTDSFWDIETSGQSWSDGGTGKTTAEMKTESTFTDAGWDFDDVWAICEGTNYPRLLWSIPLPDLVCPDGVNFIDYSFFAERWLNTDCASNNYCDGTDFNFSGMVDMADLKIFCDYWLSEKAYHGYRPPIVDTTPPEPNPMTWVTEPTAISDSAITMTAVTATDAESPPVEYYFTNVTVPSHSSGWQSDTTYIDAGLTPNTTYTYNVKARDNALTQNVTAPSADANATTFADTTPPLPDPMTFEIVPYATGPYSIAMRATTATDATGPVQYQFYYTAGAIGVARDWSTDPSFEDTGLEENSIYGYKVRARDALGYMTAWSDAEIAQTSMTIQTQIDLAIADRGGPPYTPLTVTIAAGTYNEDLLIDEPNITLLSESGAAVTIIQCAGSDTQGVDLDGSGCVLGGSAGHGFTIIGGAGNTNVVDTADNTEVSYCDINSVGGADRCVRDRAYDGVTIKNNNFFVGSDDSAIYLGGGAGEHIEDVDISDNTCTAVTGTPFAFVEFSSTDGNGITIGGSSNITDCDIVIGTPGAGKYLKNLTISDNIFNEGSGIYAYEYSASTDPCRLTNVSITGNTFAAGSNRAALVICNDSVQGSNGLEIGDVNWASVVFTGNSILRTPGGALYNVDNMIGATGAVLKAELNYWNDGYGPTNGCDCSAGAGASISNKLYIDFEDFYTNAAMTDANNCAGLCP